jgi:hypothetical protein
MLPSRASFLVRALCHLLPLGVITWTVLCPNVALAWTEKRVESSTTILELGGDGGAIVRHELLLDVHGAALTSFSLRGVDLDAEPLPDATLTRLSGGQAGSPQPVQVQARSGQLDVGIPVARGLRGTRFLLSVSYRTRLVGAIVHLPDGERSLLGWVGPRFDDGVDAVTLILRTRAGRTPPEVAAEDDHGPHYGIVMSTLRRSRDRDELELVRAHVASDEAIRWDIRLDRTLFDTGAAPGDNDRGGAPAPGTVPAALPAPAPRSASRPFELALASAAGVAYALLVWLKARAVDAAARRRATTPHPWIGVSGVWRALGAGAAVSAAGAVAIVGERPLFLALALLLAVALAAHHPPHARASLRGPGEWRPQGLEALVRSPSAPLPGAWLDAGRLRGFALLGAALAGIGTLAARAFASSPYTGGCILLGGVVLLPIFCTGRAAELPPDALDHARRFLGEVARRLGSSGTLVVTPIGRMAAANGELDELRLSIAPARPVPGLLGIELGIELRERFGGLSPRPVVVVRAAEGSECQRALPRGLTWMRGRSAEERASLVRPKLPTVALSVALLQELSSLMLAPPLASPEPSLKKASKSSGKGLSTAKAGTRASPAHAT